MDLVVLIYKLTDQLPKHELYRLTYQITRAAVSAPTNIAEAHARNTTKDYCRFLPIAQGSLMETETYVMLLEKLNYAKTEDIQPARDLITEISKMLTTLRKRLM